MVASLCQRLSPRTFSIHIKPKITNTWSNNSRINLRIKFKQGIRLNPGSLEAKNIKKLCKYHIIKIITYEAAQEYLSLWKY